MTYQQRWSSINTEIAKRLGMKPIATQTGQGLFYDPEKNRTRLVRDSQLHLKRTMLVPNESDPGFIFDIRTNEDDLSRAERMIGVVPKTVEERINKLLKTLNIQQ